MFTFNNLIPIPLHDQIKGSDIWGSKFTFDSQLRYFVEAPSGKGKTTLQHIMYGLRKDYTGSIQITLPEGNFNLNDLTLEQWAAIRQKQVSVIFQDLRLFLELTAMENIQIKNVLTNYKSENEIIAMATALEVESLLQKKCGEMSYGQRQRIAIIRALCQPFKFLIMDEPFSHLDSNNIKKCCQLIQQECTAQKAGYAVASLEEQYFLEYDANLKI